MAVNPNEHPRSSSLNVFQIDDDGPKQALWEEEEGESTPNLEEEHGGEQLTEILNLETLKALHDAVTTVDSEGLATNHLTKHMFCQIMKDTTNMEPEVSEKIFLKIDWASVHNVSWKDFCAHMSQEILIRDAKDDLKKVMEFQMPPPTGPMPHRDYPVRVMGTPDGLWITASTEATISLWDNNACLKRYKLCLSKQRMKTKMERQWITDCVLMTEFSKVILATGNRELQFYDMASFTPFCQVSDMETVPICICCRTVKNDKCLLAYGDMMGCVSVLIFNCPWKSFRLWKKLHKHEDFIPSIPIDQAVEDNHISFMRWQVHKDWVYMVKYCVSTDQIVSCSKDPESSLVIGQRRGSTNIAKLRREADRNYKKIPQTLYGCTRPRFACDQVVYSLTRGVLVFDFNAKMGMVASGGSDRMVRLWNIFLNKKPVAVLYGHYDIIRSLQLCPQTNRLFSASADSWIKVWDVLEHTCLQTIPWHEHLVTGQLRSVCFSHTNNSLAVVGDNNIAILKLKSEFDMGSTFSHLHPVKCILYNPLFNQIISACAGSTVKTWNLNTGSMEVEFPNAHTSDIDDMSLDSTNKKLVTVSADGTAKIWNYNSGMCVRTLRPDRGKPELSAVSYIDLRNVKFIMTMGWSHRLNFYVDDTPETIPFEIPLLNHWRDDMVRGHRADIICSDFSGRDKVATGDVEGNVLVWYMETCTRAFCLKPSPPHGWSKKKLSEDKGVTSLHFLKLRSRQRKGGNLVVGGPHGHVTLWNINFVTCPSAPMASFPVSEKNTDKTVVGVTALDSDVDNSLLATGDTEGYLSLWDIRDYALTSTEEEPPQCLATWQGHLQKVTGVRIVTDRHFVVSCSTDYTVRLWTGEGDYIGTFGQKIPWELGVETTYKHPAIPRDISKFYRRASVYSRLDEVEEEGEEATVEVPEPTKPKEKSDPYETGLRYFARKKEVLSKRGRHFIDEVHSLYSSTGGVVPYQSLRHHGIQGAPDLLLRHTNLKSRLAAQQARLMETSGSNNSRDRAMSMSLSKIQFLERRKSVKPGSSVANPGSLRINVR